MTGFADIGDWLKAFRSAPAEKLDRLLRHYDSISPMQRGLAADQAHMALLEGTEQDRVIADEVLADWLTERLQDSEEAVFSIGWNAYLSHAFQGLYLATWLPMPRTGKVLRSCHVDFVHWSKALSGTEEAADLSLAYFTALAANQVNREFYRLWLSLCDAAGTGARASKSYLTVGLLGLASMVPGTAPSSDDIAEGLAHWAQHLPGDVAGEAQFMQRWQAVQQAHPRALKVWAQAVEKVLPKYAHSPFTRWWAGILGVQVKSPPGVPSRGQTDKLVKDLRTLSENLAAKKVVEFYNFHLSYAQGTGDWSHFPGALDRVGRACLGRGGGAFTTLAAQLARRILEKASGNEQSWTLWAESLNKLGYWQAAESVLWESHRRQPMHVHTITTLASLLEKWGRPGEAELLYDHAIKENIADAACFHGYASLLRNGPSRNWPLAKTMYERSLRECKDDRYTLAGMGMLLVKMGEYRQAEDYVRRLEQAGADRWARPLADCLKKAQEGTFDLKDPYELETGAAEVEVPPEWHSLLVVGQALRAEFLLSAKLDESRWRLVTADVWRDLRQTAHDVLAEAQRQAPHHPLVRAIARRYGGAGALPIGEDQLQCGDFATRLGLAIEFQREDALEWAWDDFTDMVRERPVTALARLTLDDGDEVAAECLRHWLCRQAPSLPILAFMHSQLLRRFKRHGLASLDDFVDAWTAVNPEDACHLLDSVLLGLVVVALPSVEEDLFHLLAA